MSYKVLIADDEPDIIEFLEYNLSKEGFIVISATNGKDAFKKALSERPDLILLDIMMPEGDGVEICSELRAHPEFEHTIIVFLTARSEDYSQIAGFEVGADDYITKPIRPRVLVARINALLKRKMSPKTMAENILDFGGITIDRNQRLVFLQGEEMFLPKKEFEILNLLASKPGVVFTRQEMYNLIWGTEIFVGDRTIDVHVRKIREKIGDTYIKTIKGVGYKFVSK
ncbi:MAG: response regulator transcription factor [Bacteroidales bacterium]|jgi:two-component system alkaline phosphatase synthesis response regulator PhoP|nr:response regulator transcription factor [Bacteroidales bacterium]